MSAWTLRLIAAAGLVALLGRLPLGLDVAAACALSVAVTGGLVVPFYGRRLVEALEALLAPLLPAERGSSVLGFRYFPAPHGDA